MSTLSNRTDATAASREPLAVTSTAAMTVTAATALTVAPSAILPLPALAVEPATRPALESARPQIQTEAWNPHPQKLQGLQHAAKRTIDVLLASVLLIVVAPIFLLIALAVRLDSPGPAFFRQRRVGRGGHEFMMLKFRSMRTDASPDAHRAYIAQLASGDAREPGTGLQKLTRDARVTRVGGWLRKTSIDELPQLLNVITGSMSIVGPRPAVAYELDFYREEHFERFDVRPGLTGLWQVSGRSRLGLFDMLDLDVEYARSQTLALDLRLLARTPMVLLRADTA
jgi:lipopolysaccharide/colanic/teichoic acid biosynthesis glycosyltransferase